jgi:hypothetical protein
MKFILSFLIASTLLSASTSTKLSVGGAALTDKILCNPVNIFTPPTPLPLEPELKIPTTSTIRCDLPVTANCKPPVIPKCPPIVCKPPVTPPIPCPPVSPKCPTPPTPPTGPNCATPEPRTYALLGVGLLAVGLVRRFKR